MPGHGHVNPAPLVARCGGPGMMCSECAREHCSKCEYVGALHCPKCLRCVGTEHAIDCPHRASGHPDLDSVPESLSEEEKSKCTCRGLPDPEFDIHCPIHGLKTAVQVMQSMKQVAWQFVQTIEALVHCLPPSERSPKESPKNEDEESGFGICYFCGGTEGDIWPFYDKKEDQQIHAHVPCARSNSHRIDLSGE